jgi:hypothetical protein
MTFRKWLKQKELVDIFKGNKCIKKILKLMFLNEEKAKECDDRFKECRRRSIHEEK